MTRDSSYTEVDSSASGEQAGRRWLRVLPLVAVALALLVFGRELGGALPRFAAWVEGLGVFGPLIFAAGYAAAVVALAPASALTLAAGAVFGVGRGTVVVFLAAVIGSTGAFLVSRYLARGFVEAKVSSDPRFAAIDRAIGDQGRKIVFLLRLTPVVPFNVLNYALGLTRVRLVDTLIASVGMLPGTLLYVYSGKLAGDVASAAAGAGPERGAGHIALLAVGLAATLAVTILITRIARRALRDATDEATPEAAR